MLPVMESFHETFHEPYYKHYITDDLIERLETAGFQNISTEVHFMSKYLIAHKPAWSDDGAIATVIDSKRGVPSKN